MTLHISCMSANTEALVKEYCNNNGITEGEFVELETMDLSCYHKDDYKVVMDSPDYLDTVVIQFI